MKYATISDVHGNKEALSAVLKDIKSQNVDSILNLGDSLYGPLDPIGTFNILNSEENILSVCGNCDRMLLEEKRTDDNDTLVQNKEALTEEIQTWIKNLPLTRVVDDLILMCHGSPFSDEEYLLEEMVDGENKIATREKIKMKLRNINYPIILCGHTHIPRSIRIYNQLHTINPGSVGLPAYEDNEPYTHKMESLNPYAKYVLLEKNTTNQWSVSFKEIEYDWRKASKQAILNNRNDWAIALNSGFVN